MKEHRCSAVCCFQVEKYGKPNGVVGFSGVALAERVFDEPAAGTQKILFPISRTRGNAGNVTVGGNHL